MSCPKKFVKKLSTEEIESLKKGYKYGESVDYRQRCQGILLSDQGYDAKQISQILDCSQVAVYNWLAKYETDGITGLVRKAGQGRKRKLLLSNPHHVSVVEQAVKKHSQSSSTILDEVKEGLGIKELSKKSLKRFLKKVTSDGSVFGEN